MRALIILSTSMAVTKQKLYTQSLPPRLFLQLSSSSLTSWPSTANLQLADLAPVEEDNEEDDNCKNSRGGRLCVYSFCFVTAILVLRIINALINSAADWLLIKIS
jgi:hypothetical protein